VTIVAPAPTPAPSAAPTLTEAFRLRADATLAANDDGAIELRQSRFRLQLDQLGVGRRSLVLRLGERWVNDVEVSRLVVGLEGETHLLRAQLLLRRLVNHSWLRRRLLVADRPLLDVVPLGLGAASQPVRRRHLPGVPYRLSRFAALRAEPGAKGGLLATTPLSTTAARVHDPDLGAVFAMTASGSGCDRDRMAGRLGVGEIAAGRVLDELLTARLLVDPADADAERDAQPLALWSAEDLALHERSRPGRHALPVGGTYPFRGRFDAGGLARTFPAAPTVELPTPDLDVVAELDGPLTAVVAARRSIREHDDDHPVTLAELAEFLYRVQRVQRADESDDGHQTGRRPYPAGGGVHELEVYAVVARCAGLAPGVYHYDSAAHRLERLADLGRGAERVLSYARAAANLPAVPQVHLVITARVGRLMWKYEGMAYSMVLKHVGVLTELMYLVATAMGLAPCALGAGDAAAFAAATGVDPLVEPSVGDFVLGSRRPDERQGPEQHGRDERERSDRA